MKVLVLIDKFWSPITTDVLLIPEGKTPEETYVNYVRKHNANIDNPYYDKLEDERIQSMTDEEILEENELTWDITTIIGWNLDNE